MKICFQFCNFVHTVHCFFNPFSFVLLTYSIHLQLCLAVRYFKIHLLLSEKHNKKQVCLCKRIAKVFQLPLKEWPLKEGKTLKCKVNTVYGALISKIRMALQFFHFLNIMKYFYGSSRQTHLLFAVFELLLYSNPTGFCQKVSGVP